MAFSVWQAFITDGGEQVVPSAIITVFFEDTGAPATIYSTPTGGSLGNTTTSGTDGLARFFAPAGVYKIVATKGLFTKEFRHVQLGNSQSRDVGQDPENLLTVEEADSRYSNIRCLFPLDASEAEVIAAGAQGRLSLSNGDQTGTRTIDTATYVNSIFLAFPAGATTSESIVADLSEGVKAVGARLTVRDITAVASAGINSALYVYAEGGSVPAAAINLIANNASTTTVVVTRNASNVASFLTASQSIECALIFDADAGTFSATVDGEIITLSSNTYTPGNYVPALAVLFDGTIDAAYDGEEITATLYTDREFIPGPVPSGCLTFCGDKIIQPAVQHEVDQRRTRVTYAEFLLLDQSEYREGDVLTVTDWNVRCEHNGTRFVAQGGFTLYSATPGDTHTGNTSETLLRSLELPSAILPSKFSAFYRPQYTTTGVFNKTVYVRLGTSSGVTGTSIAQDTRAGNRFIGKHLNATSSAGGWGPPAAALTDSGTSGTPLTITHDFTAGSYLNFTVELATGIDSATLFGLTVEVKV